MSLKNKSVRLNYRRMLLPLMVEQLFMMLIGNVNVFLLSLYADQVVAATGLADQLLAVGTMAMGIVSLGSTVLFLQNAGEDQLPYIRGVIRQTVVLNALVAGILVLLFWLFGSTFMTWLQTPEELLSMSTLYLRIVGVSLVFQGLSTSASAILRSFGKVDTAMRISIINTVLIIFGNALVILSPVPIFGGGVIGISIATVLTRAIGSGLSFWAIRLRLPEVWADLWRFKKKDWSIGKKILELGIPSGMENVSYNFSQVIITGVIASLGTVAVTSKIYAQTITAVVFTLSVAAGQAGQIMVGRYLREKQYTEAKEFTVENTKLFWLSSAGLNMLIAVAGPLIIRFFTGDPEVIEVVRVLLWLNVLYDPLRVTNEILIASLQAAGDVRYPVFIGILVTYVFTVPASLVFGTVLDWGIYAVWMAFILDEGLRALIFYVRWKKGGWKQYDLVYKGN